MSQRVRNSRNKKKEQILVTGVSIGNQDVGSSGGSFLSSHHSSSRPSAPSSLSIASAASKSSPRALACSSSSGRGSAINEEARTPTPASSQQHLDPSRTRGNSSSTKRRRHGSHLTIRKHVKKSNNNNGDAPLYEVESVQDVKLVDGSYYFLIKWKGYNEQCNSWEPEHHLEPDLLSDLGFLKHLSSKTFTTSNRPNTRSSPPASPAKTAASPVVASTPRAPIAHQQLQKPPPLPSGMTINQLRSGPCNSVTSSSGISSGSSSCSVTSDADAPHRVSHASDAAANEIANLVLTDSLIPGKIVELTVSPEGSKKVALIKWCNHNALTWIDYDLARVRYPDIVLDYYEARLVFDS